MKKNHILVNKHCTKSTFYAMSEARGITLISLIITIVVLLILAGVAISSITGGENTIDKANEAKNETAIQAELDEIQSTITNAYSKVIGQGNFSGSTDAASIREALRKTNLIQENPDEAIIDGKNGWKVTGIKTGQKYVIKPDGLVKKNTSILPDNFQQVEYIESTGTQYIDTNYRTTNKFITIEGRFYFTALNNKRQLSGADGLFIGMGSNGNVDYGSTNVLNEWHNIKSKISLGTTTPYQKDFFIDDQIYHTIDSSYYPNANVYCFLITYNGTKGYFCNAKCNIYIIYEEEKIVRYLIPCYCTTNVLNNKNQEQDVGTIGLYDIVENKFYTNEGTGTFLKGEDVY